MTRELANRVVCQARMFGWKPEQPIAATDFIEPYSVIWSLMDELEQTNRLPTPHEVAQAFENRGFDKRVVDELACDEEVDALLLGHEADHFVSLLDANIIAGHRILTGRQLFAAPAQPLQELVADLMHVRRQGVIYGGPNLGKSTLTRIIGGGVATGCNAIFGRFPARQGVVLFVIGEEDESEVQLSVAMTAAGSGYNLDDVLAGTFWLMGRSEPLTLQNSAGRDALNTIIEHIQPALVVIDTMAAVGDVDLKDSEQVKPLVRWGAQVTSRLDCTLLWTAHDTKNKETSDLDALFGSREISARIDFAYRLKQGPQRDTVELVCTKMRGAVKPEPFVLEAVVKPNELLSYRVSESMSRMSGDFAIRNAIKRALTAKAGQTMSGLRDTVAVGLKVRPADVGVLIKALMTQGFISNHGSDSKFSLHWNSESMSRMSQHVPDTEQSEHVPMSRPPTGADWDTAIEPRPEGGESARERFHRERAA